MSYYDDADVYATTAGRVPDSFAGGFPKSWAMIAIAIASSNSFYRLEKGQTLGYRTPDTLLTPFNAPPRFSAIISGMPSFGL